MVNKLSLSLTFITNAVAIALRQGETKNKHKRLKLCIPTTKKTEHQRNRCSSTSQLKCGSGLMDFSATKPVENTV